MRTGLAAAALGSACIAAPAQATVVTPGPAGHSIMVTHNVDFVSVSGFPRDAPVTVDILRNGQVIGSQTGTPALVDGESVLDVNHGEPNCFTGFTPDILPGDHVRATHTAPDGSTTPGAVTTMEVRVDDIALTGEPELDAAGNVLVKGRASRVNADGTRTPMDPTSLDGSEIVERDLVNRLVGAPTSVIRTPGTTDGFTMVWDPAQPVGEQDPYGTGAEATEQRRETLLASRGYVGGFGHIEPPPADVQLFEGFDDVMEAGAEGCPVGEGNAVTGFDDQAINTTSGSLVVTGRIMPGVTAVTAKLQSGAAAPITAPATIDGTRWTATFERAALIDGGLLPNGPVTASADYTFNDVALYGRTRTITKDLAAPAAAVPSLAAGTHDTGATSVALSAGAGDTIHYQVNGSDWIAYNGAVPLPVGTTNLTVRVTSAAGNVTTTSLRYVINRRPVPAPAPAPAAQAAPAPQVVQVAPQVTRPSASRPAAPRLSVSAKRVKLSVARRRGLSASFTATRGSKVSVARLFLAKGSKATLLSTKRSGVTAGRRSTVKFGGSKLKPGLYIVEVRTGASRTALGAPSIVRLRVIR